VRALPSDLDGPLLIEPTVHGDERGFFAETYRASALGELGVEDDFVQDNHSRSARGVVRGMHFSLGEGQAKLARCARGSILDVVVDIRRGSPSFGAWESFALDDVALHMLYVPIGFAHGFCVTSEIADVAYKLSSYYDGALERGFAFDDPAVGIQWPLSDLIVSERDRTAPALAQIEAQLPFSSGA
jgi:dTDP-4-dehydrorhamnose 3,5-epimerase